MPLKVYPCELEEIIRKLEELMNFYNIKLK